MTARSSYLVATLFLLLVLVVESLSLKPPLRQSSLGFHQRISCSEMRLPNHFPLFMRGGGNQNEVDTITTTPKQKGGLSSILDPSVLTGALITFGNFYSRSLESSPVLTKSVTAAVLFAMSDQMAQGLEMRRNKSPDNNRRAVTNKTRSMYSALVGLLYFGPMAHLWYGWVFTTFPGKTMISILQKAALGQFFFAPPLFCVFFGTALLQNGQFTFGNWFQKIRQDLVKGWLGGIGFWPIVNYISYGYVPQKWIPLFINVMGLVFNIYVSLIANLKQQDDKKTA